MNKSEIKDKKLRKRAGHDVLNCSHCNEISDFCIMPNGDIECSYCGDVKGNIASKKQ